MRISPNERFLVTGSHDRNLHLYSTSDLSLLNKIAAHKWGVWDAEFAPKDKMIASASSDTLVKIWNYEQPENI